MTDGEIVADLDACFEAGADLVFLEVYEFFPATGFGPT